MKETRLSVQSQSESADAQPAAAVPDVYLRSERAPSPRTLIDILRATTSRFPDATAIEGIQYVRDQLCFPVAEGSFEDDMGA